MHTTERFVHKKINGAITGQIPDSDIATPNISVCFIQKRIWELQPVYKDVLIVVCPSLNKRLENPNVEGKHLLRVGTRISTFIGDVA